jgi:hypothetical protein
MFRCARKPLLSLAFERKTPFVLGVLELVKLHALHKNALEDDPRGLRPETKALHDMFLNTIEEVRPLYTVSAGLDAGRKTTETLYRAMCHFGLRDDPLSRHLELTLGKKAMKSRTACKSFFKTPMPSTDLFRVISQEADESILPGEYPNAPAVDHEALPRQCSKIPPRFRGHWVLRDPEIALTKQGRAEDPW